MTAGPGRPHGSGDRSPPSASSEGAVMEIAVIGVSGRWPGDAENPQKLWNLVSEARSARSEIPADRFNVDAFQHPHNDRRGVLNVRHGHFMNRDVSAFDAPFFSLPIPEVKAMDPQQRMALECTYEALENAGVRMEDVQGSDTSCYVGTFTADYKEMVSQDFHDMPMYHAIGTGAAILSNRVSWFYDLKGPSMTVDTACSASLVALHLACQSLRTGESKMSIVGGTNLILMPDIMTGMTRLHFLSPDGKCHSFDHRANGYARGEGAAFCVLKPLHLAIQDGDVIRGVIRNTGVNQDGNTPGITLPSSESQEALIRRVYKEAGLSMADTTYVEAHGTGTPAGDPAEAAALSATFGKSRQPGNPVYMGSVKSNIGHLEGASGLTQLVKAILMVEKGQIPASINYEKPSPRIPMEEWNLAVPTKLIPWPVEGVRRVSINSFGYGGTNAHCIIDDAYHYLKSHNLVGNHNVQNIQAVSPTLSTESLDSYVAVESALSTLAPTPKLLVWTSNDQGGITRNSTALSSYLTDMSTLGHLDEGADAQLLAKFARTLASGRSILPWKSFAVAGSCTEAASQLEKPTTKPIRNANSKTIPKLGFVFTGQGAQWYAMGRELLVQPVFRSSLEASSKYLESIGSSWSLMTELCRDEESSKLGIASLSQPACTAIQIAMIDLFKHWEVTPSSVVGHSSGEIAAAYAKGAITRENAWAIAYHRGHLSGCIRGLAPELDGSMMATGIGPTAAEAYIARLSGQGTAAIACVNSPSNVTISGDTKAIDELEEMIKSDGHFARKLRVEIAYHSSHMQVIADKYLHALEGVIPLPESDNGIKMFSSLTGAEIKNSDLDARYWVANMVGQVKFHAAVQSLITHSDGKSKRRQKKASIEQLIEFGPHAALQGPLRQILEHESIATMAKDVAYQSVLLRGQDACHTAMAVAGRLFQSGYPVNIGSVNNDQKTAGSSGYLTDLPPFRWNHELKYWSESHRAKAHRFREHPRKDLVGSETYDHLPNEPRFRNMLRMVEVPWVQDHKVQGSMLYPAAGMMIMAIEAAFQKADKTREIEGYELRDVIIGKAIVVPEDEAGVELMLTIKPFRLGSQALTSVWQEFQLYSRNEIWDLNCSGLIQVKYKTAANSVFADEDSLLSEKYQTTFRQILDNSTRSQHPSHFYDHLDTIGLHYGPVFQGLDEIKRGEFQSACKVVIPDTKSIMPHQIEYPHVIHPATLDSIIQMVLPSYSSVDEDLNCPVVPTSIGRLYVSADIPTAPGTSLPGYSIVDWSCPSDGIASVVVSNETWDKPLIVFEEFRATEVSLPAAAGLGSTAAMRKLGSYTHWQEDLSLLNKEQIMVLNSKVVETTPSIERKVQEELEIASFIYIKRVLKQCSPEEAEGFQWNFKLFYKYMQRCYKLGQAGKLCYQKESPEIDWLHLSAEEESKILERVRKSSSNGAAIVQHGEHLVEILRAQVQPLQILMQDNYLTNYYTSGLGFAQSYTRMAFYLDLVAHKNPGLRILEIGGGTAGATLPIMEALSGPGGADPRFSNFTFTDLSLGYFEKAKEKLAPWLPLMTFSKLNIEEDPITQGFEEGSYDIIVASNVLHATRFMGNTLRNARKLLKPDGKLVLAEITNPCGKMRTHMLVGSLEGWWYGEEDGRHYGPTLSVDQWDATMKEAGFTGVDVSFEDFKDPQDVEMSVIVTTATEQIVPPAPQEVLIVLPQRPGIETLAFANRMTNTLKANGSTEVTTLRLEDTVKIDIASKSCLVLLDAEKSQGGFLPEVSQEDWDALKHLVFSSAEFTYITRGGAVGSQNPSSNLMTGLARCIRSENPSLSVATIDIELDDLLDSDETATAIYKVLTAIRATKEDERHEWEYAVRNGLPLIQRVLLERGINDVIATYNSAPKPEDTKFSQEQRPLKLEIGTPGQLDTLRFTDDKMVVGPLLDDEVEIQVKAAGLNYDDVMVAMGQLTYQPLGMDCSGVVSRVGNRVTTCKPGDRVMTWKAGTFGNVTRSSESMVQRIPEATDFATAASLPLIYSTAQFALSEASRLRKGETVLIHAASRGVGQAAIILAQHIGAEIFATVSSEAKKQLLMDNYSIPEDHIFSSRDSSFVKGVLRLTNGRGVDVVLNSLSGETLRETWHCIARFGRFVEMGRKDIVANTGLDMAPFLRNVTFQAINLVDLLSHNVQTTSRIFSEVMELVKQGVARPLAPITVMPFSRIEEAFRLMQSGENTGKIVLEAHDDDIVAALPAGIPEVRFNPNATYILAGGSGGIGRCITEWMAKSGAKNILLLSRSGAKKASVKSLVNQLRKQGVNVDAWECDVGDESQLVHAVARCKHESWPPIRGVFQGAMVLRDGIYETMSRDQFLEATRPKVQGSWNLHKHLPKDMDFFVLLSSIAGITGNRGQGNYSAANTYQDSLARYRHSLGLKACAIDVGMVLGVGFVAEIKEDRVLENLKMWNFSGIREKEFLGILQAAITGQSIGGAVVPPQLITGLATGGMMAQSGNKYPGWFTSEAKFWHMSLVDTHQILQEDVEESAPFMAQLLQASNAEEASDIVCEALVKKLAKLMTVSPVDIEASRPVSSYGVDSLLAVELRSWVYTEMKADVSVFDLLSNIAISTLAKKIVSLSKLMPESFFAAAE